MYFATPQQVRTAEAAYMNDSSVSSLELMERVVLRLIARWQRLPHAGGFDYAVLFLGSGNNAGDAIGFAASLGLPLILRFAGDTLSAESQCQLKKLGAWGEQLPELPAGARLLLIDGLLGTGVHGALRPRYAELVRELNALRLAYPNSCTLAIDTPSGLDPQRAQPSPLAVRADVTAVIGRVKPHLVADSATAYVGRLLPIPLPEIAGYMPDSAEQLLSAELAASWLAPRDYELFKNRAGHLHIVAGSARYLGAARLAAMAALRVGAGLITLHLSSQTRALLAACLPPEIIINELRDYAQLDVSAASALLVGPGLGEPDDVQGLKDLVEGCPCPLVLDADALRLAARDAWRLPPACTLTPHEGEMRALAGAKASTRLLWVKSYLEQQDCTLLLKGARSLICTRELLYYNSTGGPFMANGGQGDALAGCIAAFNAQGMAPLQAAALGAYLCGHAAELACAQLGKPPAISASDMIAQLPRALGCL